MRKALGWVRSWCCRRGGGCGGGLQCAMAARWLAAWPAQRPRCAHESLLSQPNPTQPNPTQLNKYKQHHTKPPHHGSSPTAARSSSASRASASPATRRAPPTRRTTARRATTSRSSTRPRRRRSRRRRRTAAAATARRRRRRTAAAAAAAWRISSWCAPRVCLGRQAGAEQHERPASKREQSINSNDPVRPPPPPSSSPTITTTTTNNQQNHPPISPPPPHPPPPQPYQQDLCKCVDTYVAVKRNQNQVCWRWRKEARPAAARRPALLRAFLDGQQYSADSIA